MKTINISDETYSLIRDQLNEDEKIDISSFDDFVGKAIFFRTVTYHVLGKVVKVIGKFFQLEDASWIADSGRFMQFLRDGIQDNSEIEPIETAWFVNLDACSDFGIWKHKLPKDQK
jgi:hypothetical protein